MPTSLMCPRLQADKTCGVFCQIEVMHDFQGNRSCLYGSTTETDSEAEDNPEQVSRYAISEKKKLDLLL